LPSTITSIGNNVFAESYYSSIGSITINATTPPTLGTRFCSGNNPTSIVVPDASVDQYKDATNWSAFTNIIFGIDSVFALDYSDLIG
jgi:hypothetical protein